MQSSRFGADNIFVRIIEKQDMFVRDIDVGGDSVESGALGFTQAEFVGDKDLVEAVEDRREAGLPGGQVGRIGIGEGVGREIFACSSDRR